MAKKSKKQSNDPESKKQRNNEIVQRWDKYMGGRKDLDAWRHMLGGLGIEGEFASKTQCLKALKGVWVNIYDFLDAVAAGRPVRRFGSQRALAEYTRDTGRIYPRERVVRGTPLSGLLAHILWSRST